MVGVSSEGSWRLVAVFWGYKVIGIQSEGRGVREDGADGADGADGHRRGRMGADGGGRGRAGLGRIGRVKTAFGRGKPYLRTGCWGPILQKRT